MLNEPIKVQELKKLVNEDLVANYGKSFSELARSYYACKMRVMLNEIRMDSELNPHVATLTEVVEFLVDSYEKGL